MTIILIVFIVAVMLLLSKVIVDREEAKGLREREIKRLIAKKRRESGD